MKTINLQTFLTFMSLRPYSDGSVSVVKSFFQVLLYSEFQKPSQNATEKGEAKLFILDFKTSWSEFKKPNQTTAEQGKPELPILNSKTTWSQF